MSRGRWKDYLFPTEHNAYLPHFLRRHWLLMFLAVTLAAEGFLVANLVVQQSENPFLAAVVASEIVTLTNGERVQQRLGTLDENALLDAAAQRKAEDMAAKGYFSHQGPDGKEPWAWLSESGYNYRTAGENLAVRFYDSEDVVQAWMESPTHRANIVKPAYTEIGIGIADGTYKGAPATFVVQFFGSPSVAAVASAPEPVTVAEPVPPVQTEERTEPPVEVAGAETEEAVAAPDEPTPIAAAPTAPQSFLQEVQKQFIRMTSDPEGITAIVLSAVASLVIIALFLAFVLRPQLQPVGMLASGAMVVLLAFVLMGLNASLLTGEAAQTASVTNSLQSSELGSGVSTSR